MNELQNKINSEYFVEFLGVVESDPLKLVFEYIEGEALNDFLYKADFSQRIKITQGLAEALKILH